MNQDQINQIIKVFQKVTGLIARVEEPDADGAHERNPLLHLKMPDGARLGPFELLLTETTDEEALKAVILKTYKTQHPAIVALFDLNPEAAKRLRQEKIPYLDRNGNAFIQAPGVFILLDRRPAVAEDARPDKDGETKNAADRPPTRAFGTAGLKIVFALLQERDLINQPYRDIGEKAGVALGTITHAFNDLGELGFLQTVRKTRRITNWQRLFERWVQGYNEHLRPKLMVQRFRTDQDPRKWNTNLFGDLPIWWGGETAGDKLTGHLIPGEATLYIGEPFKQAEGRCRMQLELTPDPNGQIAMLKIFWPQDLYQREDNLAPDMVVYADLIATGNTRCTEAAERLYEKRIAGHLKEA